MDYIDLRLEDSLGHILNRTARAMCAMMQNSFNKAGYDVTVEQCALLFNLWRQDRQFQQQLADNTYKDKTSVTRIVDSLEKRHLAKRVLDKEDQRQKRIYLTRKGKKLQKELKTLALNVQEQCLNGIEPEHWEKCKEVLEKIYGNICKR